MIIYLAACRLTLPSMDLSFFLKLIDVNDGKTDQMRDVTPSNAWSPFSTFSRYYALDQDMSQIIVPYNVPIAFLTVTYTDIFRSYIIYYKFVLTIGAYHSSEISFSMSEVWLFADENAAAYNHSQFSARNGTEYERTETDQNVADFMTTLWTNFAKYG